MYDELVAFVVENYGRKIVEVGVGHRREVAERLKDLMPAVDILVTDTEQSIIRTYSESKVRALVDDVLLPSLQAYQNASLIYSINPPFELVPALEKLAGKVGSDLLVKPISDEQDIFYNSNWQRVTTHGHPIGWLLRAQIRHSNPRRVG